MFLRNIYFYSIAACCISIASCKDAKREQVSQMVKEWTGKEIRFPSHTILTRYGQDTLTIPEEKMRFTIVSYVDSIGCVSCKLQLPKWQELIALTDSLATGTVSFRFYFHAKDMKEMRYILKRDRFSHPVCLDLEDEFNRLNRIPEEMMFQTFLLDGQNRVVAIGNPVHNAQVKELYLSLITGKRKSTSSMMQTTASFDRTEVDLGEIDWKEPQTATFNITNTGENLLVIYDADTSCGCVKVDFPKEPIRPGKSGVVKVTYTAEHPENICKTVSLHCNISESPVKLRMKGKAK